MPSPGLISLPLQRYGILEGHGTAGVARSRLVMISALRFDELDLMYFCGPQRSSARVRRMGASADVETHQDDGKVRNKSNGMQIQKLAEFKRTWLSQ